MEILKEVTNWDVDYRQPNHTYLVNNKGQIIACAKWHSNEIEIYRSRQTLNKRYRKFVKDNHSELSKLFSKYKNEDNQKEKEFIPVKTDNIRTFKVKSKEKEYLVEYNKITKNYTCSCIGFGYRRKCRHVDAVAKKIQ